MKKTYMKSDMMTMLRTLHTSTESDLRKPLISIQIHATNNKQKLNKLSFTQQLLISMWWMLIILHIYFLKYLLRLRIH